VAERRLGQSVAEEAISAAKDNDNAGVERLFPMIIAVLLGCQKIRKRSVEQR
jgi:hypothetical protein